MAQPKARGSRSTALGCYFREVAHFEPLSVAQEQALFRAYRAGSADARRQIIEGNLRLVISIARQYRYPDMPLEDLIEEGNMGLMHAVPKFDPDRGCRFSTYAVCWIRQYIERGRMMQGRLVRLPVHVAKRLNKMARCTAKLSQLLSRDATPEEIARLMETDTDEVRELSPWQDNPSSLDSPGADMNWHEVLPAQPDYEPEHVNSREEMHECLYEWLEFLAEREETIIRLRFGLGDRGPMTLEAIAAEVGVTRERVRQLQIESLNKMKTWLRDQGIRGNFLDED